MQHPFLASLSSRPAGGTTGRPGEPKDAPLSAASAGGEEFLALIAPAEGPENDVAGGMVLPPTEAAPETLPPAGTAGDPEDPLAMLVAAVVTDGPDAAGSVALPDWLRAALLGVAAQGAPVDAGRVPAGGAPVAGALAVPGMAAPGITGASAGVTAAGSGPGTQTAGRAVGGAALPADGAQDGLPLEGAPGASGSEAEGVATAAASGAVGSGSNGAATDGITTPPGAGEAAAATGGRAASAPATGQIEVGATRRRSAPEGAAPVRGLPMAAPGAVPMQDREVSATPAGPAASPEPAAAPTRDGLDRAAASGPAAPAGEPAAPAAGDAMAEMRPTAAEPPRPAPGAAPVALPQLRDALAERVRTMAEEAGNEAVRLRNATGTAEVELAPAELGRLRLQLSTTERGLHLTVLVDRPESVDAVRRHLDGLHRSLMAEGVTLDSFDIGSGARGQDQAAGHGRSRQDATGAAPRGPQGGADAAEGPAASPPPPVRPAAGRLDIRL